MSGHSPAFCYGITLIEGAPFQNGIESGTRSCPLKPKPGLNGPPDGYLISLPEKKAT